MTQVRTQTWQQPRQRQRPPLQQMPQVLPPPGAVRVQVARRLCHRMISTNATRGEVRFAPSELHGLPDGAYRCVLLGDGVALATSQSIKVCCGVVWSVGTLTGLVTANHVANDVAGCDGSSGNIGSSSGPHSAVRVAKPATASLHLCKKSSSGDEGRSGGDVDRCLFCVPLVEVTVLGELSRSPLLKMAYRCIDRQSYLDWGLTSDYDPGVTERRFREGSRREAAREHASLAEGANGLRATQAHGVSGALASGRANGCGSGGSDVGACSNPKSNEPRGLGGNTKGSEGYGEVTQGSLQRLCCLLSGLREHVLGRLHGGLASWPRAWDLRSESSLVDVGSGYGKAVRSPHRTPRLQAKCASLHGLQTPSRRSYPPNVLRAHPPSPPTHPHPPPSPRVRATIQPTFRCQRCG